MTRRLLLLAGSAGTGKTDTARNVARSRGAGWLQLDTIWIALRAAATPGTAEHDVLNINARLGHEGMSEEAVLEAQIAASEVVCRVLPAVFAFEFEAQSVLVAEGAWLLPSFVAGLALEETEVHAVYLRHTSCDAVRDALAPRLQGRPEQARHRRMARAIWLYGNWLAVQARAQGLTVIDSLPFESLQARAEAALAGLSQ
jgi:2-phosphoglycerate kinase